MLETHVLCAYLVSLFSGLCSPFSFLHPVALPLPLLSLSLSLSLACACASLWLRPSLTQSFACVDVARLGPDQLSLCRLCGSGWRGGRCCVSLSLLFPSPPFPSSLHLLSLPFLPCSSYSPSVSYALTPWHFPHHHPWPQWLGRLVDSERRQQPPSLLALVAVCGEPPPAGASPRA